MARCDGDDGLGAGVCMCARISAQRLTFTLKFTSNSCVFSSTHINYIELNALHQQQWQH